MSIKNLHIIHFVRNNTWSGEYRYICCGSYTKEKSTKRKDKVTCFNCLHALGILNRDKLRFTKQGGKKK